MYRLSVFILVTLIFIAPSLIAQTAPPALPEPEIAPPVLSVPPGYRYESRGRRDPFVNPIPKTVEGVAKPPVIRPPGLKGVLFAEATLGGVVTSREPAMNKVVIQAPNRKTYFAATGDALFDAVIKEIRPDSVVFTVTSNQGEPQSRDVVRRINPVPGENK